MPPKAAAAAAKLWKVPPIVKAYEALGALADKRIRILSVTPSAAAEEAGSVEHARRSLEAWLQRVSTAESATTIAPFTLFAECQSSSLDKKYQIALSATPKAEIVSAGSSGASALRGCPIMQLRESCSDLTINVNDNGAMFQGYLGYPAVALLVGLGLGAEAADERAAVESSTARLAGVPWKRIAVQHKNNWDKVVATALEDVSQQHGQQAVRELQRATAKITELLQQRVVDRFRRAGSLVMAKPEAIVQPHAKRERSETAELERDAAQP